MHLSKNLLIAFVTISLITFPGCGKKKTTEVNSQVIEYREPIDPLSKVGQLVTSEQLPSYRNHFINWETGHDSLVRLLGKNFLAVVESHEQVMKSIRRMGLYLEDEQEKKLWAYGRLYKSLLGDAKRKISPRILRRRYNHLKREIYRQFSR